MLGAEGNDSVFGGAAGDILLGVGGNDYIVGEAGSDDFNGGEGNDRTSPATESPR